MRIPKVIAARGHHQAVVTSTHPNTPLHWLTRTYRSKPQVITKPCPKFPMKCSMPRSALIAKKLIQHAYAPVAQMSLDSLWLLTLLAFVSCFLRRDYLATRPPRISHPPLCSCFRHRLNGYLPPVLIATNMLTTSSAERHPR